MATATSRRPILTLLALAAAAVVSGCGASSTATSPATHIAGAGARTATGPSGFAWLRPAAAPTGWPAARIPAGAVMPYPAGWRRIHGDAGTATAVLRDAENHFLGYLNLTPRQGAEALGTWAAFRTAHNAEEGDRAVTTFAAATGLRFRTGRGSCVRDGYTTSTGHHYIELACLVQGPRAASVIVGAAPPATWAGTAPLIERAISALTT
jgi:hypothetical protein